MFIKDLQPRITNVDVEGEIVEMGDIREFNKMGKEGKVCTAFLKDGTGKVKLSLWNEQIEQVRTGSKIKIEKGYVSEWQGELQLTTGKFGTLEVLKDDSTTDAEDIVNAMSTSKTDESAINMSKLDIVEKKEESTISVPKPDIAEKKEKESADNQENNANLLDIEEEDVL